MKGFLVSSIGILAILFLTTFLPTQKRVDYLRNHRNKLAKEVETLREKNQKFRDKIKALEKDSYYLEWMVRKKFRFLRPGEKLVK